MNVDGGILIRIRDTIMHRINQVEAELERLTPYLTDHARTSLIQQLLDLEQQLDHIYHLHQSSLRGAP